MKMPTITYSSVISNDGWNAVLDDSSLEVIATS